METINSVATAAAKAVWGEQEANKEPVSGVQGDTAKGEPYDAGNLDSESQAKKIDPKPQATASLDDTTAGQNDTRPPENVSATEETKQPEVDTKTPGPTDSNAEPEGPSPRPLATVAKENGGDAGNDRPEATKSASTENMPESSSEGENKIEEKGTGEEYVRATGFAADGGDFDASKPGAGREADRLLDEKQHGTGYSEGMPAQSHEGSSESHHSEGKEGKEGKPSLGERIKAKLHKH